MAESTDNVVMYGMKGLIGNLLVFKRFYGRTVVARRPARTNRPPTPGQAAARTRFTEAAAYAKKALADPDLKAAYAAAAKPGQTAYNMAFADYYNPPVLSKPNVEGYTGQAGEQLGVLSRHAHDGAHPPRTADAGARPPYRHDDDGAHPTAVMTEHTLPRHDDDGAHPSTASC